jgi:hypothetical protein
VRVAADPGIGADVRGFLADHIDSVLELELLLLLRARRERSWSAAELSHELKIDRTWAAGQLAQLAGRRLLSRDDATNPADPRYAYAPPTPAVDATVTAVADAYASHRVTVIGLIFSKPAPSTLKTFADAFRIRKEKDDG